MAAIDFPASPTVNQIFVAPNGITYKWTGTIWISVNTAVTPVSGYAWSVKMTADQAMPHGASVKLAFNAVGFERNGANFTAGNSRVTPPAGLYFVSAMSRYSVSAGVTKNAFLWFRKNGIDLVPAHQWIAFEADGAVGTATTNALIEIAAGDYLEVWGRSDASNSGTFNLLAVPSSWDGFRVDGVQGAAGPAGPVGGTDVGAQFLATATTGGVTFATVGIVAPYNAVISGNTGGFFSTSTSKFRPPAGRYLIGFNVYASSGSAGTNETFQLRKNGVSQFQAIQSNGNGSAGSRGNAGWVDANGSDEFDVYVISNPGNSSFIGPAVGNAYSTFWAIPASGIAGPQGSSGAPAGVSAPTYDEYLTYGALPGAIPYDNTPPLITEGSPIFSRSYTAMSAAHRILVECSIPVSYGAAANATMALFIDGVLKRTSHSTINAGYTVMLPLKWAGVLAAGAHAYEVRIGITAAGIFTNGPPTGQILAGSLAGVLTIQELNAP